MRLCWEAPRRRCALVWGSSPSSSLNGWLNSTRACMLAQSAHAHPVRLLHAADSSTTLLCNNWIAIFQADCLKFASLSAMLLMSLAEEITHIYFRQGRRCRPHQKLQRHLRRCLHAQECLPKTGAGQQQRWRPDQRRATLTAPRTAWRCCSAAARGRLHACCLHHWQCSWRAHLQVHSQAWKGKSMFPGGHYLGRSNYLRSCLPSSYMSVRCGQRHVYRASKPSSLYSQCAKSDSRPLICQQERHAQGAMTALHHGFGE